MELKGSKTEKNLLAAFAGESQAHTKYLYYAKLARKDGYSQIADIFEETAKNEQRHARIWYNMLHEGTPLHTNDNLKDAAAGEHYEWRDMYAKFSQTALEEGFAHISALFQQVGKIEKSHEERFEKLLESIVQGTVFTRAEQADWICSSCGHIHQGPQPPEQCPVCGEKRGHFHLRAENY